MYQNFVVIFQAFKGKAFTIRINAFEKTVRTLVREGATGLICYRIAKWEKSAPIYLILEINLSLKMSNMGQNCKKKLGASRGAHNWSPQLGQKNLSSVLWKVSRGLCMTWEKNVDGIYGVKSSKKFNTIQPSMVK